VALHLLPRKNARRIFCNCSSRQYMMALFFEASHGIFDGNNSSVELEIEKPLVTL